MQRIIFVIYIALAAALGTVAQVNTDQVVRIGQNALYFEDYAVDSVF